MAWTEADLAAIDAAIASGDQTIQFQDRTLTRRSIRELLEARAIIVASLNARNRQLLGVANKGFEQ